MFDDWLEYIIRAHTVGKPPELSTSYSKDEITIMWNMYAEMIRVLNLKLTNGKDWFDFPGTYYEPCVSTPYQREKAGQFFTPPDICDLLTAINLPSTGEGHHYKINDPTAGSGRCLLSAHVHMPGSLMVAEDLDHTCVLMTVVNFLVHGVDGLVIWHNTITQDFIAAWRVNEFLSKKRLAVPHCQMLSEEEYFLRGMMDEILLDKKITEEVTIMKPTKQATLEGLFG